MRMLIINGSPLKDGAVRAITNRFSAGAQEAGHEVIQFNAGSDPLPMLHVDHEQNFQLSNQRLSELKEQMIKADTIVFTTPLYFFGMSAQMKLYAILDQRATQRKDGCLDCGRRNR